MPKELITEINGMDVFNLPESLPKNYLAFGLGLDLKCRGKITGLPTPEATGVQANYMVGVLVNGVYRLYYSTDNGLYEGLDTPRLISAAITGEFSAVNLNNLVLISGGGLTIIDPLYPGGSAAAVYDVQAPETAPVLEAVERKELLISSCDSLVGWSAVNANLSRSSDANVSPYCLQIDFMQSCQVIYRDNLDLTVYSDNSKSYDSDYLEFSINLVSLEKLISMAIVVDINDGSFAKDAFIYIVPISEYAMSISDVMPAILQSFNPTNRLNPKDMAGNPQYYGATEQVRNDAGSEYQPFYEYGEIQSDPMPSVPPGRQKNLLLIDQSRWINLKIHKHDFYRIGSSEDYGWHTVKAIGFFIYSDDLESTNTILLDEIKMTGGGQHSGTYIGMVAYGVADGNGNTIHLSSVSPVSQYCRVDQQKIKWTIPTSPSPVVNQRVLFLAGGLMGGWYCAGKVNDNITTEYTTDIADWEYCDPLANYYRVEAGRQATDKNAPPPLTKAVNYQQRLFGFGPQTTDGIYSNTRFHLTDWPEYHIVTMPNNGENIYNLVTADEFILARGVLGEYRIWLNNLDDITTINIKPVAYGERGVGPNDAVFVPGVGIVTVSPKNINICDGNKSQPLSGRLLNIVDNESSKLRRASVAFDNNYIYVAAPFIHGDYTLAINLHNQEAIYAWDKLFACLSHDPVDDCLWGIADRQIYKVPTSGSGKAIKLQSAKLGFAHCFTIDQLIVEVVGTWLARFYYDDNLVGEQEISAPERQVVELSVGLGSGRYFSFSLETVPDNLVSEPALYFPIVIIWAPLNV